jgi:DNA-binding CsgD family transcriptional regulator
MDLQPEHLDEVLTKIGVLRRLFVDQARSSPDENSPTIISVNRALGRYEVLNRRGARIVEMRFFGGLTLDEIAALLQLSPRTVKREWSIARAWLHANRDPGHDEDDGIGCPVGRPPSHPLSPVRRFCVIME